MDEKYWKQFEASGKIEDYLSFAAVRNAEVDGSRLMNAYGCHGNVVGAVSESGEMTDVHYSTEVAGETGQTCRNIFM